MDVLGHNREAWDGYVAAGNGWTIPVGPEVIAQDRLVAAREGLDLETVLYEDGRPDGGPIEQILPCFLATRSVK